MKIKISIFFAALALILSACSSIDCNLEGRILCHYDIQDVNGDDAQLKYPLSVIFHRVMADSDTVYINKEASVSSLDLPMSNWSEADSIFLKMDTTDVSSIYDTLVIAKTNIPTFEGVDCAARYRHDITSAHCTHNFLDTLIINNPKVSNDATVTNIYIRLNTAAE